MTNQIIKDLDDILAEGHGGGNWRRLFIQLREKYEKIDQPNNWEEVEKSFDESFVITGHNSVDYYDYIPEEITPDDIKSFLKSELQKQANRYEGVIKQMVGEEFDIDETGIYRIDKENVLIRDAINRKRQEAINILKKYNINIIDENRK